MSSCCSFIAPIVLLPYQSPGNVAAIILTPMLRTARLWTPASILAKSILALLKFGSLSPEDRQHVVDNSAIESQCFTGV
jgi:hypothetical protein